MKLLNPNNFQKVIQVHFINCFVVGFLTAIALILIPGEADNHQILGFSPERFSLLVFIIGFILVMASLYIYSISNPDRFFQVSEKIADYLALDKWFYSLLFISTF
jgi:hypothetical protein